MARSFAPIQIRAASAAPESYYYRVEVGTS